MDVCGDVVVWLAPGCVSQSLGVIPNEKNEMPSITSDQKNVVFSRMLHFTNWDFLFLF